MNIDEFIKKVVQLRIFYDRNLFTDSMRGTIIILASVINSLLVGSTENRGGHHTYLFTLLCQLNRYGAPPDFW